MNSRELTELTRLMMSCDPWPVIDGGENQATMRDFADEQAQLHGYDDWTMAYNALN